MNSFAAEAQIGQLLNSVDRLTSTANNVMNTVERVEAFAERMDGMSTRDFNENVRISRGHAAGYEYDADNIVMPTYANGAFTNFKWRPVAYFEGQLFPSTILTMYSYKKKMKGRLEAISRPLGFRLLSDIPNIKINWEISCDGNKYFDKVTGTELYREAGVEQHLMPVIAWRFDVLLRQEATAPITIYFKVSDDRGHEVRKVHSMQVRSINDCIYGYLDMNLNYLLTGYIQEEHPEIEKILGEALNTKMVDAITGYQQGPDMTNMQVAAVWRVLNQRGFKYSSISRPAVASDDIDCQVVRTFEKAIKSKQANCVDGTIVLASILRRMNISTLIVLTKDHCFLGYYTDRTKTDIVYLETTMISRSEEVKKAKTPKEKTDAYIKQFMLAVAEGERQYKEYRANDAIEAVIDVDKMRYKVSPIPFLSEYTAQTYAKSKSAKSQAKPKATTTQAKKK